MKTIVDDITMPAQQCVKPPENVVFQTGWKDRRAVAPDVVFPQYILDEWACVAARRAETGCRAHFEAGLEERRGGFPE